MLVGSICGVGDLQQVQEGQSELCPMMKCEAEYRSVQENFMLEAAKDLRHVSTFNTAGRLNIL